MFEVLTRFIGLLSFGLAAGGALCVYFIERQLGADGAFYTLYKQLLVRALTVRLPALGLLGMVATLADAGLLWRRGWGLALGFSLGALLLNAAAMAITKGGLFPLNAEILTWDAQQPPNGWTSVQAKWGALHLARTIRVSPPLRCSWRVSSFARFHADRSAYACREHQPW